MKTIRSNPHVLHPAALFAAAILPLTFHANAFAATGEETYQRVCQACHGTGAANAPKFGDKTAWRKLIAEPQHVLTAHGYVGVRGMPAKGGDPNLSLEDFARATAHMARAAGAKWKDPDAKLLKKMELEVKKREQEIAARTKSKP
ncbi:MAG: c-type cytochrome [Casimicrobiaceae bacterium]